ncbi:hypothetical protein LB553_00870 [Mesorhizobium sp. CA8]|uniref:hypothetical protein n=1 Tax=Mesorhizobium sp. CA8 TaxID=2876637 RepID=UPI001CCF0865|nr:hypothetical protein [Mesorhizobium sp. CA8]MBZ9759439.1 hypothetical protein [Mesorhizobium sp. CA8]
MITPVYVEGYWRRKPEPKKPERSTASRNLHNMLYDEVTGPLLEMRLAEAIEEELESHGQPS